MVPVDDRLHYAAVSGPRPATTTGTGAQQRSDAVPLSVGQPGVTRHQDQAAEVLRTRAGSPAGLSRSS